MSAMDNILHKAKQAVNAAGKKTGTAVELSKLKLQIMQLRSQVQSTYERIGILVYEQEKTGTDNSDAVAVCIKEVDKLLNDINDANVAISLLKDGVKCSNCGVNNNATAAYCKKCGASLKNAQSSEE